MKRLLIVAAFALMPALGACEWDMTGIGDAIAGGFNQAEWGGGEPIDVGNWTPPDTTQTAEPAPDCRLTTWLSGADYQVEFDQHVARGCYPAEVEGREQALNPQFRGRFVPVPSGSFAFVSAHGHLKASFEQRDAELQGRGFQRVWLQTFTPSDGVERFQATWTKP